MTTFSSFQEVIRDLCRKHKLLLHDTGGTAFIPMRFGDESPANISDIKPTYVKLMNVTISGVSETMLVWTAELRFLQNIPAGDDQDIAIEMARDTTLRIAIDFDERIRWELTEKDEDSRCYFINKLSDPLFTPVGLTDQTAIGWDMIMRFDTDRSEYVPGKWTE